MDIFKHGFKMIGSMIVAAVISFFLCISMLNICQALFTVETGYKAYVYENETAADAIVEYEHTYVDTNGDGKDDSIDEKEIEYREKGWIVEKVKQRSTLTGVGKALFLVTTQVLSLIMVISFAGSDVYKRGFKDSNLIRIGKVKYDFLKGFKIGLIGNIPFFVLFVLGVALPHFRTLLYASLNSQYYAFIVWITAGKETLRDVNILQYILLFLLQFIVPVISGIAYVLGVKEVNLAEKIMYKKEVK